MEILIYILALLMCSKYFKVFKKSSIIIGIKEINNVYSDLYNEENFLIRVTQSILVIFSEICCFISIYYIFMNYVKSYIKFQLSYSVECGCIVGIYIIFHYLIGYLLLLSSNLHMYMCKDVEESIKSKFLLSYFLTSVYLVLLLLVPKKLSEYIISGFLSIGISYIMNIMILIKFMKNPRFIKINNEDSYSFGRVLVAALIVIFMLVIDLFLLVCLVSMMSNCAFSNNPSYFELFYYTVVSFSTIGFGDIVPISKPAKLVAILISVTSLICISIFLGAIYSTRKK